MKNLLHKISCSRLYSQQRISIHAWKTIALLGIEGPNEHFKANPFKTSLGLFNQTHSYLGLFTQWHQFVSWFKEFLNIDGSLMVFPNPLLGKYSMLMNLGSTSISTIEWSHVVDLTLANTNRRSVLFRYFLRQFSLWRRKMCVFPDVIAHHATISNLSRYSIFTLGLVPLSYQTYRVSYPLFILDSSLNMQFFFLNLLRHLYTW